MIDIPVYPLLTDWLLVVSKNCCCKAVKPSTGNEIVIIANKRLATLGRERERKREQATLLHFFAFLSSPQRLNFWGELRWSRQNWKVAVDDGPTQSKLWQKVSRRNNCTGKAQNLSKRLASLEFWGFELKQLQQKHRWWGHPKRSAVQICLARLG